METAFRYYYNGLPVEIHGENEAALMEFKAMLIAVPIEELTKDIDHGKGIDTTQKTSKGEREAEGSEV